MKINLCLLFLTVVLASCAGSGNGSDIIDSANSQATKSDTELANAPNAPAVNMKYCFFHTDGTQAQDTTNVSLLINGNKVSGEMNWLPKEKDSRKGTLTGTLTGNDIKALWSFGQEGSTDTMSVEFELRGNALAQKPYKYDEKTGVQQTDGTAKYTVVYNMKNCR